MTLGWQLKPRSQAARQPGWEQNIHQAADVMSHAHAIETNDRLGVLLSRETQFEQQREALGRMTSATEHERALEHIHAGAPRYAL